MWQYWWILAVIACTLLGTGAAIWLYSAVAMTRVVSPSASWLSREAQYNAWGIRLMVIGVVLASVATVLALGHWM
jgi:hypothetical protein